MFFLIRNDHNNESDVLGIINDREVLKPAEVDDVIRHYTYWEMIDSYSKGNLMPLILVRIVQSNLDTKYWLWERITQPEYETYRDLHEFRVLVRDASFEP